MKSSKTLRILAVTSMLGGTLASQPAHAQSGNASDQIGATNTSMNAGEGYSLQEKKDGGIIVQPPIIIKDDKKKK